MNAFTIPAKSLASKINQSKPLTKVDANPRYHGYFIESGAQAKASFLKTQKILKGAMP